MRRLRSQRRGFTLIELMIVLEVMVILMGLAIPNIISSRRDADEASAIGSLKALIGVENGYRAGHATYGSLAQLRAAGEVDPSLGAATGTASTKSSFYFSINGITGTQYWITAYRSHASTLDRQFYTDEAGVVFMANAGASNPTTDTDGKAPNPSFKQVGQ